jgi:hypothetical protein
MAFAPDVRHELTPEDARKGALRAAEVKRQKPEQAAAKMEAVLAAEAEKIAAALLEEVLQNPPGHAKPCTSHPRGLHASRRPPPRPS